MLTDEMIADGWKPHDGGPCPVSENTMPDILFRDGEIAGVGNFMEAWYWDWDWQHSPNHDALDDIIAYKPEDTSHAE